MNRLFSKIMTASLYRGFVEIVEFHGAYDELISANHALKTREHWIANSFSIGLFNGTNPQSHREYNPRPSCL